MAGPALAPLGSRVCSEHQLHSVKLHPLASRKRSSAWCLSASASLQAIPWPLPRVTDGSTIMAMSRLALLYFLGCNGNVPQAGYAEQQTCDLSWSGNLRSGTSSHTASDVPGRDLPRYTCFWWVIGMLTELLPRLCGIHSPHVCPIPSSKGY